MTQYKNSCLLGDSAQILKTLPDNLVDLTVTSPPYDDIRTYEGYVFDFETIARELYRVTKDGGIVVWIVGDKIQNKSESGTSFKQALFFKSLGFNLHDTMIYEKTSSSLPDSTRYDQAFEFMFILSKGTIKTFNPIIDKPNKQSGSTNPTKKRFPNGEMVKTKKRYTIPPYGKRRNIWTFDVGFNKGTKDNFVFEHPATFPEQLAQDHILSWSNENDLVLDPFAGSGTTLKMAKLLKRDYLGIEISQKYIEIINKRLEKYDNQPLETWLTG